MTTIPTPTQQNTIQAIDTQLLSLTTVLAEEVNTYLNTVSPSLSRFSLSINIEGPVGHGDRKITFSIGKYCNDVTGDSIHAVVTEYARRANWETQHKTLNLPKP